MTTIADDAAVAPLSAEAVRELERQNCCSPSDLAWNSTIHKAIVSSAVEGLKSVTDPALKPHAQAFLDRWKHCQASIEDGLDKADIDPKYTDVFFSTHFYDPDTRGTWGLNPAKNALSEGSKYYFEAAKKLVDGAPYSELGFSLGIALHYLTDLSVPMHAANFITNPLAPEYRHSTFEDAADKYTVPTPVYDRLNLAWGSPGQLLRAMAIESKRVFTNTVWPLMKTKSPLGTFTLAEVKPAMDEVMQYALKLVASYLLMLEIGRVAGTVHNLYRRFLERDADDSGIGTWGGQLTSGVTVKQVATSLIGSGEFLAAIANAAKTSVPDATRMLYRRCLARNASDEDVKSWEGWMKAGRYYDSAKYMLDSQEYDERFGPHIVPY